MPSFKASLLALASVLSSPFVAAAPTATPNAMAAAPSTGYKNVAYFPNWDIYGRNYQPQNLPASQLTHVLYAFANVNSTGGIFLSDTYADLQKHYPTDSWNDVGNNVYGCIKQLYILKKQNRNMKVLLSVGGWTYGPNFAAPMATAAGRAQFAASAAQFVQDLGLDGIDVDWEYPANSSQAANFVQLLQATRSALDAYTAQYGGNRQLLTIASPAGPANYDLLQLGTTAGIIDFYNLMAYDYDGSFGNSTGHQANLYPSTANPNSTPFSTDKAVKDYIAAGVPSRQIVLGMPLYGRAFDNTAGLGQPFNGVGSGSWEDGVWDFKVLPIAPAVEEIDSAAGASYSWDQANQILVSYDNLAMSKTKTQYITSKGLGGGMWWEASGDRNGSQSLIGSVYTGLQAAGALDTTQNTLNYPASQYDNMRAGMPNN